MTISAIYATASWTLSIPFSRPGEPLCRWTLGTLVGAGAFGKVIFKTFLATLRPVYTGDFCRAEVASSFDQVRNSYDIKIVSIVYPRTNSRRFHGDFIAGDFMQLRHNIAPRVHGLHGQRMIARWNSEELEFFISAIRGSGCCAHL